MMYVVKNASKVPITVIITTIYNLKRHHNFLILSKVMATIYQGITLWIV